MKFPLAISLWLSLAVAALAGSAPVLKYQDGGTNNSSGFVTGNVPIGASNGGIQDSGNQLIKTGVAARNPGATDDSTQGYVQGSIWVNTASGALFVAGSVAPSAAVWTQATPTTYYSYQSISWTWGANSLASLTLYTAPGGVGTTQNFEGIMALTGTLSNLSVQLATAPGVGQNAVVTLYTGTPKTMTASTVTCTISDANTSCSDLTHSVSVAARDAYSVQIVWSAGAAAPAQSSTSVQAKY